MGEPFNELFFHCYHFHSWYLGGGVPNDFETEKKLYEKSVKSLERIMMKRKNNRWTRKQKIENAAEAIWKTQALDDVKAFAL